MKKKDIIESYNRDEWDSVGEKKKAEIEEAASNSTKK